MWGMGNRKGPKGPMKRPSARSSRCSRRKTATEERRRAAAGRRISGRSVLGLLVIAAVIASAFVAIPLASSANPDISGFELDGNVVDGPGTGDDWATLFNADGLPTGNGSARATVFVADGVSAPSTPASPVVARRTRMTSANWGWGVGVTPARTTSRTRTRPLRRADRPGHPLLRAGARRHTGRRRQHGLLVPPGSDRRPERRRQVRRPSRRRRRPHPELADQRRRRFGRPRVQVGRRSSSTRSRASTRVPARTASSAR